MGYLLSPRLTLCITFLKFWYFALKSLCVLKKCDLLARAAVWFYFQRSLLFSIVLPVGGRSMLWFILNYCCCYCAFPSIAAAKPKSRETTLILWFTPPAVAWRRPALPSAISDFTVVRLSSCGPFWKYLKLAKSVLKSASTFRRSIDRVTWFLLLRVVLYAALPPPAAICWVWL